MTDNNTPKYVTDVFGGFRKEHNALRERFEEAIKPFYDAMHRKTDTANGTVTASILEGTIQLRASTPQVYQGVNLTTEQAQALYDILTEWGFRSDKTPNPIADLVNEAQAKLHALELEHGWLIQRIGDAYTQLFTEPKA